MSRLPLIGVAVCNTRSGLNSSRAAGPWRVCAAPLAAGLALLSRTLGVFAAIRNGCPPYSLLKLQIPLAHPWVARVMVFCGRKNCFAAPCLLLAWHGNLPQADESTLSLAIETRL